MLTYSKHFRFRKVLNRILLLKSECKNLTPELCHCHVPSHWVTKQIILLLIFPPPPPLLGASS